MEKITLKINGQLVEAWIGMTVLEAAQSVGIYIPTLCYDPDLEPYGGCRMCLVEIEDMRGLPTACTTPATNGMVVHTETPAVTEVRRTVIDLLIADHPQDCLTCGKNQRCELQKAAAYLGITERRLPRIDRNLPVDESNPFFKLDRNYCILCARCVRACDEVTMVNAIELVYRGFPSRVSTFGDKPFMESICRSCGECVVRCPTAALVPKQMVQPNHEVLTTCAYCGVGCTMYLGTRGGQIVSVRGDRSNPPSQGRLCVKGRFGSTEYITHPDRLTTPLVRKNGAFTKVSWDEALAEVANRLSQYQPDEVAVVASAKCTNEENYVLQKFTRAVLGTHSIDHCARLCHSPTVAGLATAFGSGAMTNSITDIADSRCLMAIGTNTTEAHPVMGFEIKKAVRKGTAKLIVINPREIDLVRHAELWLKQRPGTDVPLIMGMCRVIVDEGLLDSAFIAERCEDFAAFRESLKNFELDFVERTTGVPREQVVQAARMYATNKPASIFYAMGITQHTHGTDNVMAIANLAMLTGNIGKPGSGVNPLRGQNNVQGACDMGGLPNVYPGYQSVADPAVKQKFEAAWGYPLPPPRPGLTITEIFDAASAGKIKALYIMGENPVLTEPDARHAEEALKKLELLVVQDFFMTETAKFAHIILPGVSFAEKDGTFVNTERRVQRVRKAIEPVGEAKPDWWIICQVAQKMGKSQGFTFNNPSEIMDEIAKVTPSYGGISYKRLEAVGIQWPCPTEEHPGTPILHTKTFTRGKGKFMPLEYKPCVETPDKDYPLILTTGRSLFQYHTGTMSRRVRGLNAFRNEEFVEINPQDAEALGIADGEKVKVISRRGEVRAKAKVTDVSPPGVVFMTFHFAESPTNQLTNPAIDPVSKIPEFKVCAVRIEKANEPN